jgi:predicted nucleic acid-binding protein
MTSTLIDSNVMFDILDGTPIWKDWSIKQLRLLTQSGDFVINQIVYAEVSIPFKNPEQFDRSFPVSWARREDIPWKASFRAGKAYLEYKRRGGSAKQVLPDFIIGAHAAALNYRLITRDAPRFRTYFPELQIIAPDTHP